MEDNTTLDTILFGDRSYKVFEEVCSHYILLIPGLTNVLKRYNPTTNRRERWLCHLSTLRIFERHIFESKEQFSPLKLFKMLCTVGVVGIGGEPMKWAFKKAAQTFSMFPGDMTDTEDLDDNEDEREEMFQGLVDEGQAPIIVRQCEPHEKEYWEAFVFKEVKPETSL